jgi:hypothetical protein
MSNESKVEDRLLFLLDAYDDWVARYVEKNVAETMVGLTATQDGLGMKINMISLAAVVSRYFSNVASFKAMYGFREEARLNPFKVAGMTMYWISKLRPIQDSKEEPMFAWANEEFAIELGVAMAGITWDARTPNSQTFFHHLRVGLQTSCLSPESLVLILLALAERGTASVVESEKQAA